MQVEASLEAAVLGWVATHPQGGSGRPLVEVLAHELGLDPNPDTLDGLAAVLVALERDERIVLDGPVDAAVEVAPLDLTRSGDAIGTVAAEGPPRIAAYSEVASAARHVQLNWALRALRDRTDPATGQGELDLRQVVGPLGLNPKDVRHDLESLGLLRRLRRAAGQEPEVWWVDRNSAVTPAALDELEQPAPPPAPAASPRPRAAPARAAPSDLAPIVDSLSRLEPRLGQSITQLLEAAESLRAMAVSQSQLLREQTQELATLRQECDRLLREVADLRRDNWSLRRGSARSRAADELSAEAANFGAAERRVARTGAEIDDKLRRVTRALQDADSVPDDGE